jgi:hypothetical protein
VAHHLRGETVKEMYGHMAVCRASVQYYICLNQYSVKINLIKLLYFFNGPHARGAFELVYDKYPRYFKL